MDEKTKPYKSRKSGRFQISLFKFEKVIRNGDTIRSELIVENIRICVQHSYFNNNTGQWKRQQIWCSPEEIRDLMNAVDNLTLQE